jgi:hypothetical protein
MRNIISEPIVRSFLVTHTTTGCVSERVLREVYSRWMRSGKCRRPVFAVIATSFSVQHRAGRTGLFISGHTRLTGETYQQAYVSLLDALSSAFK